MGWEQTTTRSSALLPVVLQDLFSAPILMRALLPFLLGLVLTLIVLLWGGVILVGAGVTWLGESTNPEMVVANAEAWLEQIPIIGVLLAILAKAILGLLISFLGVFVLGEGMVLMAMLVTAFLTPGIVRYIHRRHYSTRPLQTHGSLLHSIMKVVGKTLLLMLVLVLSLPVLWIPLLNLLWFKLVFFLYFRSLLLQDVAENCLSEQGYRACKGLLNMPVLWATAVVYSLSVIPVMNLFVPIIGVVVLTHLLLREQHSLGWQIGDLDASSKLIK